MRTSTVCQSRIVSASHSVWTGGVIWSSEPTQARTGTRTSASAPGAWKNPEAGASSPRRVSRLSGEISTGWPGPNQICPPPSATSMVAPIECPTPATVVPGWTKASSVSDKRLARRVNSASVGFGETIRSKYGATTVQPDSANASSSVWCRSGLPPAPTAKITTMDAPILSRTETSNCCASSCSVSVCAKTSPLCDYIRYG